MSEELYKFSVTVSAVPISGSGQKARTEHVNENMTFPASLVAYTASVNALRQIIGKVTALQKIGPVSLDKAEETIANPSSL